MTITPETIIQVINLGILTGIFMRMGSHGEAIGGLKRRVNILEEKV